MVPAKESSHHHGAELRFKDEDRAQRKFSASRVRRSPRMIDVGIAVWSAGAIAVGLASAQKLIHWRGQLDVFLLVTALVATLLWTGTGTYFATHHIENANTHGFLGFLETLRNIVWLGFLLHLLAHPLEKTPRARGAVRAAIAVGTSGVLLYFASNVAAPTSNANAASALFSMPLAHIGFTLIACACMLLLIRLHRYTNDAGDHAFKYLALSLLPIPAIDFLHHGLALANITGPTEELRAVGVVVAGIGLLTVASKNPWSRRIHISHNAAFHFVVMLAAGSYVSLVAIGAYYFGKQGVEGTAWLQSGLLLAAFVALSIIYASERRRAQLKVFFNKHFFNYKYDYRDEWLRFIRTLSRGGPGAHLLETVIQALSQIVNSEGGTLWLRSESTNFDQVAHINVSPSAVTRESSTSSLVQFLRSWQWIINLREYRDDPDLYQELVLPPWLNEMRDAWLVVPLMQDVELLGFVVVCKPQIEHEINWEDHDLLKTAGRQAATHLAQLMAVQALVEAREFQAFSRLSAFVIHDLKNLVAQLSLVANNAAKHKHNPEFMEDAISTVENCVAKMNRLLAQLRKGNVTENKPNLVNLANILREVINHRADWEPRPTLAMEASELMVVADADRLSSVMEHLVQNAQDATPGDGWVKVKARRDGNNAVVEIADNGCGMDANFIRDRLFRPFDSTKGQGGMGIGAYESREYINELRGAIQVVSEPGKGSTFTIHIPLSVPGEAEDRGKPAVSREMVETADN